MPETTPTVRMTVNEYAKTLEVIYENRTAGDFTFHGVLGEFLKHLEDAGLATIKPDLPNSDVLSMEVAHDAKLMEENSYVLAANGVAEKYGISLSDVLDMIKEDEDES